MEPGQMLIRAGQNKEKHVNQSYKSESMANLTDQRTDQEARSKVVDKAADEA
jgi:hypothetical protein